MKFEKRRKPKISLEQAKTLAADYVAKHDLRELQREVVEVKRVASDPDHWTVVADHVSPDMVVSSAISIVHGETGDVITFDEYFEAHMKGLDWPLKAP